MKFNWGNGLVLAYGAFTSVIIIMVSISISKDVDLVAPDYYNKEIKYQEEINRINNTNKLPNSVKFEVSENEINIAFPVNSLSSVIKGEILFYKPSDSKKDFKVNFGEEKNFNVNVNTHSLDKGLWKIKILWNMDGVEYLSESTFFRK